MKLFNVILYLAWALAGLAGLVALLFGWEPSMHTVSVVAFLGLTFGALGVSGNYLNELNA